MRSFFLHSVILWIILGNGFVRYNNFTLIGQTLKDLWFIDSCVPLIRDKYVLEIARGAII
jgi:hypothetical protein